MKRILNTIALALLITGFGFAQSEVDALRFSQTEFGGTARSMSMGGAFGALGGDFSCLSYNPAGLGIYRHSEFTFTPGLNMGRTESTYYATNASDGRTNLDVKNMGFIGAYSSGSDEGWVSVNFGLGYNRMNNFFNRMAVEGVNSESSMIDYFQTSAEGSSIGDLNGFYEGLAYMTWLLDSVGPGQYASVLQDYNDTLLPTYGARQSKSVISDGGMGEYVFSLGANYSHKVYFGVTLGIQNVRYTENYSYVETDDNDDIYDFNSFQFDKYARTRGYGFNLKFGVIYRPIDWIRIGGAIHTPTFYSLNYKYNSSMSADYDNGDAYTSESPNGEYNYEVTTPFKAIGSLAFVIMKKALVSVDYEFIDYSQAQMNSLDAGEFNDANSSIRTNYVATSNIRGGLEYRIGPFSLRGGAAYYGSPYASSTPNADAYRMAYTGGFGIKDNNIYFDLAYVYLTSQQKHYLYSPDIVTVQGADVTKTTSQVVATFGVKF